MSINRAFSVDAVGTAARLYFPTGVAYDGGGTLYVADRSNGLVRTIALGSGAVGTWIGTAGVLGVRLGQLPARLDGPHGVAVIGVGDVVVSDFLENTILRAH